MRVSLVGAHAHSQASFSPEATEHESAPPCHSKPGEGKTHNTRSAQHATHSNSTTHAHRAGQRHDQIVCLRQERRVRQRVQHEPVAVQAVAEAVLDLLLRVADAVRLAVLW